MLPGNEFPPPETRSAPVLFEIVPPVQVAELLQVPPLAETVSAPELPVLSRMMPGLALDPVAEMLRKVRPDAPMVVFATLSAPPVVEASVLMIEVLFCVALTVPPPVAVKAVPGVGVRLSPPVKLTVAPVLVARLTALAVVVVAV